MASKKETREAVTAPGFQRTLQWAADQDRLMEGEDPGTTLGEDARHWADVYTELMKFNQELLAAMRAAVLGTGDLTAEQTDNARLLEAHMERLRYRRDFWRGGLRKQPEPAQAEQAGQHQDGRAEGGDRDRQVDVFHAETERRSERSVDLVQVACVRGEVVVA